MSLINDPKILLLDEPTNDLDVNTLRALEEGLENFAGCAVVISHDRWFLDRICTHILSFEGNSQVYFFEGSYSDYLENKKKRLVKLILKVHGNTITESKKREIKQYKIKAKDVRLVVKEVSGVELTTENISF